MEKKDEHLQMNELQGSDDQDITEKSPLKNDTDANEGFENKKNGKEKNGDRNGPSSKSSSCLSSLKAKLLVIILVGIIVSVIVVAYLFYLQNYYGFPEDSEIVKYLTIIPALSPRQEGQFLWIKDVNQSNWQNNTNEISEFLDLYHINITKQANSNYTICKKDQEPLKDENKVCYWDITEIEKLCMKSDNYGYSSGNPCLFIKFQPHINFTGEPYDQNDLDASGYNFTNYKVNETNLYLHCEAFSSTDKENSGTIQYAPVSQEFPKYYFMNEESENFLPPFIAIKLNNLTRGIVVDFRCRLLARNIIHDDNSSKSPFEIQFSVLID